MNREQQPAILLVNDNLKTLMALESALSDDAFCVVTASSGEQALRKLLDRDFACIILDVQMPGFDGFQTAEAIRDRPRTATTPIIFATATMVDNQSQFIGYERGAVDYLLTPIVPRVLKAKVAVFVELFKQKEQLERMTRELAAMNRELHTQQLAELARVNSELSEEVAERRRAQERADFLASHDPLTGLLNRRALGDRVKHAVQTARRSRQSLALLFLDLDRFKTINDTLGHDVGDALLNQVAERLRGAVRESDTVARLGGDEFVVLVEGLATPQNAADVAEKMVTAINEPFCVGLHTLNTSASVGISLFPGDAPSAEELLKHADLAMYHAKNRDRGNYQFFSDDLNAQMVARHELERELHQALKRGELTLHYQPKVDLASGCIAGAEALLRWRHPERGLIASGQFIPVAEESRLIIPIGEWVLKEACSQVKQWERAGALPVEFGVAVNVSVAQVHPNLVKNVVDTLAAYEIPPRRLQLEITETLLSRDPAQASSLMQEISALGITIAIDDFGTGYSSLAALKNLPIETLKIDQSFVLDLTTDLNDAAIVAAIISMARSLALKVVAEGVETEDQLSALKALGCDQYQGYLFSRPVPPEELARMLAAAQDARGQCPW